MKVYTVGIGEQGTAPMPVATCTAQKVLSDVPVDVDEATLQKIADKTGGKYYRADNAEKFQQIYAEIDKLEKTEADDQQIHRVQGIVSLAGRGRAGAAAD